MLCYSKIDMETYVHLCENIEKKLVLKSKKLIQKNKPNNIHRLPLKHKQNSKYLSVVKIR